MDKLEEILRKYQDKKFLVIELGGNNGDRLIYLGLERKLLELGIKYTILQYKENSKLPFLLTLYFGSWKKIIRTLTALSKNKSLEIAINKMDKWIYAQTLKTSKIKVNPSYIILIHGSGNINDVWGQGIRLLKSLIKHNPESVIIVAPQTYWFRETCFPKLFLATKQEIHLFCREKYSYNLLKSMNLPENVHIFLSPDTAFYLSKEDFHIRQGYHDLICLRTDKESALFKKKEDIAKFFEGLNLAAQLKRKIIIGDFSLLVGFRDFIRLIETSKRVYTDRLHVAILAAILGKETVLYPNSYYKNRGVYEYSLSNYPNVKFIPFPPALEELKQMYEASQ